MANVNGVEIDLMPNEGMRKEAQRYRDWKADGEGGGTDVARTRASQILSGNELSADTVITMSAWFARHEVDKQGKGFSPGEEGYPSNGRVAWAAWGGDPGKSWSDARAKRIKAAEDRSMSIDHNDEEVLSSDMEPEVQRAAPDALKVGDYVSWNSSGGRARGLIEKVVRDGTIDVPDSSFTINGTPDDPAALICVYRDGEKTDTRVGHRFSTLTKIEPIRSLVGERMKRTEATEIRTIDDRTFEFPFSSEYPVSRYFGTEVLSHDDDAPNFMRLNDGAPFLFNHNPDKVLGVVERAWHDKKKKRGYAKIRFSRSEFAKQYLDDVKDGILRGISFGYSIDEVEERGEGVVATKWSPHELSLVSIPADPTIGIGRSLLSKEPSMPEASQAEDTTIDNEAPVEKQEVRSAVLTASTNAPLMEDQTPNLEVIRSEASADGAKAERDRIAKITAYGDKYRMPDLAQELVRGEKSLDEARAAFLEKISSNQVEQPIRSTDVTANDVGLSQKEVKRFSFVRALNYLASPGDATARRGAEFEIEVGLEAAKQYERSSNGIVVPNEVLRRDLTVGVAADGGNLVDDVLLAGSFIEILRNKLALANAGMTTLTGINGNISIPRQNSAATAYWVGENSSPTESQQAVDQVNLSPKTCGAFVDYSRRLLLQSSIDVESMVRNDIAAQIALELDRVGINGSGSSNQPQGIINTSGIGSQSLTGFGTFAEYIGMETDVAVANADAGNLRYIINASARGALKSTEKASNTAQFVYENDEINGYPVTVSNQLGNNDALFGDFSMLIMAMWSGLDLTVDPYAGATAGTVRIIALQDVDFAVKQPGAFCFAT
ncbi:MAG TPA: phage major capsid protein [Planctomycetaceae bacterium]|nr:phage major capsid protein [uncultured Mediterranean phage uvMED]HBK73229.1 phage major capsid protein [Planctomycetaceae bacterium]